MSQFPPAIRLLHRFGLSPQKVLLVLSDLLALLGTGIAIFLLRAAFDNLDSILYRWVLPLLLLGGRCSASLGLYQSISLPAHRPRTESPLPDGQLTYCMILAALFWQNRETCIRAWSFWAVGPPPFTLPILRGICRRRYYRKSWWGRPDHSGPQRPGARSLALPQTPSGAGPDAGGNFRPAR